MSEYVSSTVAHIRNELHKVIVGQDDAIEQILIAVLAEGHALIEGVPGTAKTLTVKTLSRIIKATFSRIQFTPDLMPSDITGTNVFNIATSNFNPFSVGHDFCKRLFNLSVMDSHSTPVHSTS